jgi:hypothetical protein
MSRTNITSTSGVTLISARSPRSLDVLAAIFSSGSVLGPWIFRGAMRLV